MKDTQGNPITEEEFMKDIGHGVVKQDWKEQIRGVSIKSDTTSTGLEVQFEPEVLIKLIESLLSEARVYSYTSGNRDGYDEGRNAVLSEVEREVEKVRKDKELYGDPWDSGYVVGLDEASTIINNLRVK